LHLRNSILSIILLLTLLIGYQQLDDSKTAQSARNSFFYFLEKDLSDSSWLQNTLDSLKRYSTEQESENISPLIKLLEGNYLLQKNEYESAKTKFDSILYYNQNTLSNKFFAETYLGLAKCYRNLEIKDSAEIYYHKAAAMFEESGANKKLAEVLNTIGYIHWQITHFDSAIIYFERSLKIKKDLPDKDSYATTLNNIGTVHYHWASYDIALEYYLKAFEIKKEVNNFSGAALVLTNIGLVYKDTEQIDRAIECFFESIEYAEKDFDNDIFGYIHHNIGSAYLRTDIDSAEVYFEKAMWYYAEANSIGGIIISLKGLGETQIAKENYLAAKEFISNMHQLAIDNNNALRIAEAKHFLGIIAKKEFNISLAKKYLLESIIIAEEIKKHPLLRDNYKLLSEIYEGSQNINDALNSYKEYMRYHTLIADSEMEKRLSRLKQNFEVQKYLADLEIQKYELQKQQFLIYAFILLSTLLIALSFFLTRTNKRKKIINAELSEKNRLIEGQRRELEKINNELIASNAAKDKLFSIIAHDLKNPFFNLMGYISLLREGSLTEEELNETLIYLDSSLRNTYSLLENLLDFSLNRVRNIEYSPTIVEIKPFLNSVIEGMQNQLNQKTITVKLNISYDTVFADISMLQIVLRNLITNAIKFSHPGGEIHINFEKEDNKYLLSVIDDGVGIDEQTKVNLFNSEFVKTERGTLGEKGTGIGLNLCKDFIDKHGGKIVVNSKLGAGSEFIIELPAE